MARKKKGNAALAPQSIGNSSRISTSIDEAENGFVINVSGESGGKKPSYFSKRYIASSRPQAMRIAGTHFSGAMKSGGKKAGRKKSIGKR